MTDKAKIEEITQINPENNIIIDEEMIELDLIKEEYEELKYELPDFEKLCEDFDVEKAFEKKSSYLLREIRKLISEKLGGYLQLLETIMNPGSAPIFILTAIKNLTKKDRETAKKLYAEFSKSQIVSIRLDTIYNEDEEAKFIKQTFEKWQTIKVEICDLLKKLEDVETQSTQRSENIYFN
ncbi:MAG: hypothetical protein ACI83O_000194 [Patescibacteria group bacterium]|jgi:hypothetical protein